MTHPLVTIICISYNHAPYIQDCIDSIKAQTHQNIELIFIDDCSTDNSKEIILKNTQNLNCKVILNEKNMGNCATFNKAFRLATGKYILDLAADDVLLPTRLEKQVLHFQSLPSDYGIIHSNCLMIDQYNEPLRLYQSQQTNVPDGMVFKNIIEKNFICSPTILVKKEVYDFTKGYNESYAYEDFDFFIQASQKFKFGYQNQILTKKRILSNSLSTQFYQSRAAVLQRSTYDICKNIISKLTSNELKTAFHQRVRYELKTCFYTQNKENLQSFYGLLQQTKGVDYKSKLFMLLSNFPIPIHRYYIKKRLQQAFKKRDNFILD